MAPGWVRISQLHMKEERLWDSKLRVRARDCVWMMKGENWLVLIIGAPYGSIQC